MNDIEKTEIRFNNELARLKRGGNEGFEPFSVINGSIFKEKRKKSLFYTMAILPRKDKIIEEIEDFLCLDDLVSNPHAQRLFERMKRRSRITGGGLSRYRKNLLGFQEKVEEYNLVVEEIDNFGLPKPLKARELEWGLSSPLNRMQFYRQNGLPDEINLLIEEAVNSSPKITNFNLICIWIKGAKEKREKQIQEALNIEMPGIQELKEKAKQQKEIKNILAKEIKEYQAN
jgi:hypothetical protein